METNTNTPEAKQPAGAGCHPTPCSLPTWDFVEDKVNAGKPITALEAFIHEHDDADPKRSAKFMAMLSDVLAENETAQATPQQNTKNKNGH